MFEEFKSRLSLIFTPEGAHRKSNVSDPEKRISFLKKMKIKILLELGELVYKLYREDRKDPDAISLIQVELEKIDEELGSEGEDFELLNSDLLKELHSKFPKGKIQCDCGLDIEEGMKFCGVCGRNIDEYLKELKNEGNDESQVGERCCGNCGALRMPDDVFCLRCGKILDSNGNGAEKK